MFQSLVIPDQIMKKYEQKQKKIDSIIIIIVVFCRLFAGTCQQFSIKHDSVPFFKYTSKVN